MTRKIYLEWCMYLGVITLTKLLLGFNQKIFSEKHLDSWTHDFNTFLTSVFITTVDLILHQYLEINLAFSVFKPSWRNKIRKEKNDMLIGLIDFKHGRWRISWYRSILKLGWKSPSCQFIVWRSTFGKTLLKGTQF